MPIGAAYVRVSTDEQTEYSPAVQLEEILQYAKKTGYTIPQEFIFSDEGISGKSASKRPAFQEMIRTARKKQNHIEAVFVHKFDRFARKKDDSVIYKALLKKDGVKVISVKEPIPEDDKFAVIYESMLEAMAEYYSLNLAEEVKKTMVKKANLGEWQTTPPYGYTVKDKTLQPVPEEAELVQWVFSSFLDGMPFLQIAKNMNEKGARTHRGNRFENRTIQYMICNPAYKGYARWTPTVKIKRNFNHPDSLVVKGNWEPIISEDVWNQANQLFQSQKKFHYPHQRPETDGIHWLSGMVKCSACGSSLVVAHKFKNGNFAMQCGSYNHGRCAVSHYVTSAQLIPAILDTLEEIAGNPESSRFPYVMTRRSTRQDDSAAYAALISKAEHRLQKAKEAYLAEVDTLEEYKKNKTAILSEIDALREKMAAASVSSISNPKAFSKQLRDVITVIQSDQFPMEEKKTAFRSVVEKIIYDKENKAISLFLISD